MTPEERDALIEECAKAAEAQDRSGHEWVHNSLWENILKRAGRNVRRLKHLRSETEPMGDKANSDPAKYRNAILWAVDYFGTSRLTEKERAEGVKQLGNALLGRPSRAADYAPNEWDTSLALSSQDGGVHK